MSSSKLDRKQKGGFVKGWFWRMYPRSGFWYRGTYTYPRSSVWCRGTSESTLVFFFCTGEHPPKPPFWKPPSCERPTNPPRCAQAGLSTNLGVLVSVWLVLSLCDTANSGVFDLCRFDLCELGCATSGGPKWEKISSRGWSRNWPCLENREKMGRN